MKTWLAKVAEACGCENVIDGPAEACAAVMKDALDSDRMTVLVCKCESRNIPVSVIKTDPVVIRDRFMTALKEANA